MKSLYRLLLSLLALLATLLLMNCSGAPGCPQAGFGSSTPCAPGGGGGLGTGGGGGGGGGGGPTPAAFAYAVDTQGGATGTGANGTIDGYDLSTSAGTFAAIPSFAAPSIVPNNAGNAMIVAQKQFVYALFDGTNVIYGWSIDSKTGALTALTNFPFTAVTALPNVAYNQYNVTTDPAGNFLFVASTGLNQILVYSINSGTGALTLVQALTTPEPGNLTTDGLGKYLYVCENVSGHAGFDVQAYSIGTGGTLTAVPGTFNFPMWQLQGDASGNYLIGTTGSTAMLSGADDDHLYVFSINTSTNPGAITQVGSIVTQFSPFNIAVSPPASGAEFVYSFSMNDTATAYNNIEGYSLNITTGALTALTNSPFSTVGMGLWGQFDQSGANLVVYSNTASIPFFDGLALGTGPVTLIPLSVDSSGNLTQPIAAPAALVTPGYWVVTDP
jgi:6-phosphogluconolactonase